jgi:hypothetical protein
MSFAICRMEKMKSHDLKGTQFHNQRERESKTNPDIDKDRSHLNYDLVNQEKIDYNKRVKEIIESQKIGTRKTRKDAVLVNELLVTSDRAFFDRLKPNEQKRFFEESYKLFAERYGEQNIAYATVHHDEKTPHLHLGVVPMKDGKLQGKHVFNRNELRWIQDEFPKHLQKQGFDVQRGEKGSDREHLTTQEFKAKTLKEKVHVLEQALNEKQAEKQAVEKSIKEIKGDLSALEGDLRDVSNHVQRIDQIETKKPRMSRESVLIKQEDFVTLQETAKKAPGLVRESVQLKNENQHLVQKVLGLETDNQKLRKENKELRTENSKLKNMLGKVQTFLKENELYVKFNEFIQRFSKEKERERKTDLER